MPSDAQARHQFELAAREEGHAQAAAFAWLGNWEMEVAHNGEAARELYNVALDLDPAEPAAGTAGSGLNPMMTFSKPCTHSHWRIDGSGVWDLCVV